MARRRHPILFFAAITRQLERNDAKTQRGGDAPKERGPPSPRVAEARVETHRRGYPRPIACTFAPMALNSVREFGVFRG
jgi:hypothetical protein